MASQAPKVIVAILLLVIVGFGSYLFYTRGLSGINIGGFSLPSEEGPVGSDILVLAEKIKLTVIEPEILESNLFRSLVDMSSPLSPESQGRPNPFAPIGFETANVISSTNSSDTASSRTTGQSR
ncbi:MAG: hypothetical protein WAX44_01345 [Minisyncoccia bacterium]